MVDIPTRRFALEEKFEREKQEEKAKMAGIPDKTFAKLGEFERERLEEEAREENRRRDEEKKSSEQQSSSPEAKADQSRYINIVAKLTPTSKWGWSVVIFILIILWVVWYFKLWEDIIPRITYVFVAAFLVFVSWGLVTGVTRGDKERFFISLALIVWAIDLTQNVYIPFIGPISVGAPFAGFFFDWRGVINTDWIAVISSFIVFLFLYFNMLKNIVKHEYRAFGISFIFILLMNNYATGRIRLLGNITIPYGIFIYFALIILGLFLVFKLGKKLRVQEIEDFFSYLFMIIVFSFFWVNNGWVGNLKSVIHVAFILWFGFGYIAKREAPLVKNISIPLLLIIDFYGYGALFNSDYLILKFIPLLIILVISYCYYKTNSGFALASFIVLVTIFVIFSFRAYGYETSAVQFEGRPGQTFDNFLSTFYSQAGLVGTSIKQTIESRLEYATGGYYKGYVEKNQFEPLGVFFDRTRAAQPRFYTDEDVTIWSTVRARTLSDPVVVNFTCFRWKDGKRIEALRKQGEDTSKLYDEVIPPAPFTVFTLEDKDVECTFRQDASNPKLQAGSNTLTLSAVYNFDTSAYQKVYFIDKERQRAMVRENLDPLKEFGITDRTPKPIHTNGPVEIGVGIEYLILVPTTVKPLLAVSLTNRGQISDKQGKVLGKWEGKIKKINELVVVVPKDIIIEADNCKPAKFIKIENQKAYCDSTCLDVCKRTCDEFSDEQKDEKESCIRDCEITGLSDAKIKCDEDCAALFKSDSGEQNYVGYSLDTSQLKNKDEYKDIDRFRTFACRINPSQGVLENVPITTKYIRIRARYDYLLEGTYPVTVEQVPTIEEKKIPEFNVEISEQKQIEAFFNRANTNEVKYSPIAFEAAKKYNVDYFFIKAIIQVESSWNPAAKGDGGASIGIMQVSTGTASGLGCASNHQTDPASNIDCGVKYLRYLIDIQSKRNTQPDLRNIAASYNCGEKAMDSDVTYGLRWKNPDSCWSQDRTTNSRIYVNKVMNVYNALINQLKIDYISKDDTTTTQGAS